MSVWHQLFPSIPLFVLMCFAVLIAGTIRSFTGFGGGLVLAPLFSLFMQPADMVVVVLLLNFLTSVQTLRSTWHTTDWRMVRSLSIPALFGVPLGVWLVEWMDPNLIRRMIGVIVASLAGIMLVGWQYNGRRGPVQDWIVGVTSGALTAIAGVGGPPLVLYLLSVKNISPIALRSFFMMFFTFAQISTMTFFLYQGLINKTQLIYSASFAPVYLVSTFLGTYLFLKALKGSVDLIKRLSLWFLLLVGCVTLLI
jgi:uncharacterized membrane protein YfcA